MTTFGMVLFIICIIGSFFLLGYGIYRVIKLVRSQTPKIINWKQECQTLGLIGAGHAVTFFAWTVGACLWSNYALTALEWAATIFGGIIFPSLFYTFLMTFIIHYYGKELNEKFNKWLFRIMFFSVPLALIFLFIWTDGFAAHLTYPLPNMLSFTKGFTHDGPKPAISFYALFILGGAVLVYFLCDHKFYQQYGIHGKVESTFLVAFPAGIIGARIAYVIGEWNNTSHGQSFAQRVASGEWWSIFAIWEGGLTILGGAIGGIVVGVLWFMWRNKGYSIWVAVDLIVPTILIAQAIGRWGNFFNNEVHGASVAASYWSWLPTIISKNIAYSSSATYVEGNVFVPLFLIESITNLIGYYVIADLFGRKLRRYTEFGDLAFAYLIWYGLTRVLMEPLRDSSFVMGKNGYWSWFWSIIYVVVGIALVMGNHFVRYLIKVKKGLIEPKKTWFTRGIISFGVVAVISLASLTIGATLMAGSTFAMKIEFNQYNIGIIFLALGVSVFVANAVIAAPYLYQGFKVRNA